MTERTIWLDNRKFRRIAMGAWAALLGVGAAVFATFGPILGVPGSWLLMAFLALAIASGFAFTRRLPFKVGVDGTTLVVRWVVLSTRIDLREVQKADFLVSERQRDLAWSSRYYDLRLHLPAGREVYVGTLDGPVALRVLGLIPSGRARLGIWSRGQLVEEQFFPSSVLEATES